MLRLLRFLVAILGGRHMTNETRQLDRDSRNGDGRRRLVGSTRGRWPDKSTPERVVWGSTSQYHYAQKNGHPQSEEGSTMEAN